jgi:protein TonB
VLLLAALAAVLVKDRDFWFGSGSTIVDANVPVASTSSQVTAKPAHQPASVPAHTVKKQAAVAADTSNEQKAVEVPIVATDRTVLPPLDVEVVAGNTHRKLHPGSNATKLETNSAEQAAPAVKAATNAAQHQAVAEVSQPAYPPLAQHMNVQGSVVLQALIGADGSIQNLRVMSGPAILASAAQQAVREWRFKPIVQNGQAVESKATITVNFTIKVADNSANATLAESRPDDVLILTR